jgi:hypothetical protein
LKYAAAITLLAAPCSHTKTTWDCAFSADRLGWQCIAAANSKKTLARGIRMTNR